VDIGQLNQTACFCSRIVYVPGGGDGGPSSPARRLAAATLEAIGRLPASVSDAGCELDTELRLELQGLRFGGLGAELIEAAGGRAGFVISADGAPVDFASRLGGRIANIVATQSLEGALRWIRGPIHTVGVYPESLREAVRDRLAIEGVQRLASLGHSAGAAGGGFPHDGIEPLRLMCRWVTDESVSVLTETHVSQEAGEAAGDAAQ
jgi:hypothetical protein